MRKAAAVACVEQLLGQSLRQALPGMEEVAASARGEVERANARLIIDTALEMIRGLDEDVLAFETERVAEFREDEPLCSFCWRAAARRANEQEHAL